MRKYFSNAYILLDKQKKINDLDRSIKIYSKMC